jgi:hypothetical protein
MTKHKLIAAHSAEEFIESMMKLESKGWQAIPTTFGTGGKDYWNILMFKVESNSPYRFPIPPNNP